VVAIFSKVLSHIKNEWLDMINAYNPSTWEVEYIPRLCQKRKEKKRREKRKGMKPLDFLKRDQQYL
jgi:hypothetical protein